MKFIYASVVIGITLLFSANSFAVESTEQVQLAETNVVNVLTKEQRHEQRQLFLQQKNQMREERNKVLRAQHAEKYLNK